MLSFVNVTKSFTLDDETSITPVRDLTLQVQQGEFIMVVGRSGTGKTTLLNLAAGLVSPTSGCVTMEGADLRSMSQKQLSLLRNRKIGFVFQFPSLIPALTVIENVTLPSIFSGGKSDGVTSRAEGLLASLGLSGRVNAYPRQLSAGETKRVVIARSLINEPKLILADEPTSDLDDRTEDEVMGILREINSRGVTFVMVTHSVQLASFATRAFEMADGVLSKLTRAAK
jgi:ABC-type lipoprotein export system ATPase subunit